MADALASVPGPHKRIIERFGTKMSGEEAPGWARGGGTTR